MMGNKEEQFKKFQEAGHAACRGKHPWNYGLTKETDERIANSKASQPKSDEWKESISKGQAKSNKLSEYLTNRSKEEKDSQIQKSVTTKKKNGTINTSKPEEKLFEELKLSGKKILRNYKDKRYPYYCDFYIVEDDLFIELNAHWTHGGKPFDSSDQACLDQLEVWKEKAQTSQFYANAIITWTVRDVEKAKCAKDNGLNYKVIY